MILPDVLTKEDIIDFGDVSYRGYPTINTAAWPFRINKDLAIQNAVKMYLMSQAGDYGRDVYKGGPLFSLVGKLAINEQDIKDQIIEALKVYSNIVVVDVTAEFEAEVKTWHIKIRFQDTLNKIETEASLAMKL